MSTFYIERKKVGGLRVTFERWRQPIYTQTLTLLTALVEDKHNRFSIHLGFANFLLHWIIFAINQLAFHRLLHEYRIKSQTGLQPGAVVTTDMPGFPAVIAFCLPAVCKTTKQEVKHDWQLNKLHVPFKSTTLPQTSRAPQLIRSKLVQVYVQVTTQKFRLDADFSSKVQFIAQWKR